MRSTSSTGSTSENQPAAPPMVGTTPTAVTMPLVTRPANPSVMPSAAIIGQAVGAGSSMNSSESRCGGGSLIPFGSARRRRVAAAVGGARRASSDHVHGGEDDHPHRVDEVPVPGEYLDALGMRRVHGTAQAENQHQREQHEADGHVAGVEADQRVVGGAEQVGPDRQVMPVDQAVPFN